MNRRSGVTSRRDLLRLAGAGAAALVIPTGSVLGAVAQIDTTTATTGASIGTASIARDLDDSAAAWNQIYPDERPGYHVRPAWRRDNVAEPSLDGHALRLGLTGDHLPGGSCPLGDCYVGLLFGRTFAHHATSAIAFRLETLWRFSDTTINNRGSRSKIEAVEFGIDKWSTRGRYEWGLQWLNVQGDPDHTLDPSWRIWDGSHPPDATSWVETGLSQALSPDIWHYLQLTGTITNGRVRYRRLVSDEVALGLPYSFGRAIDQVGDDALQVTVQLDGNAFLDPYDVYLDRTSVLWSSFVPW